MSGSSTASPPLNHITAGATLYSTLASVLAGFAFTAIVLLVAAWLGNNPYARRVLGAVGRALVGSFFGLLIMAVGYAAESTNPSNDGVAASENTILAAGFAGAGVLLIYTVVLLLDAADEVSRTTPKDDARKANDARWMLRVGKAIADQAITGQAPVSQATVSRGTKADKGPGGKPPRLWDVAAFARASACVLNLLIMGLGDNAIGLYEGYRYGPAYSYTAIDVVGWSMLGAELGITLWAGWRILGRPVKGLLAGEHATSGRLVSIVGFGLPVLAGIGYLVVDSVLPDTATVPPVVAVVVLAAIFAVTAGGTVFFVLTRPPPTAEEAEELIEGENVSWRVRLRRLWE